VSEACVRVCEAALGDLAESNPDQSEIARYIASVTGVELGP
jgi:3-hydroxyisobutyrate dehydrogenase